MNKIAIIMPGSGDGRGQEPVVFNRINALYEKCDITLLCLQRQKQTNSFIKKVINNFPNVKIEVIPVENSIATFFLFIRNFILIRPLQNVLFTNSSLKRTLIRFQEKEYHIIFITSRSYSNNIKTKNFSIDFIDSLSLNFYRKYKNSSIFLKPILYYEAYALKKLEKKLALFSKNSFIVSEIDKNYIDYDNIIYLPIGVSSNFFNKKIAEKSYDVLFFGNLFYDSNIIAIEFFLKEILPIINRKKKISFLVSGRNPTKKIKKILKKYNATLIENPILMLDVIKSCKISIAPMLSGSGMQNKILESMAAGVPVVCNTLGLGTIGAEIGNDILVEDDPKKFAYAILRLLEDEEYLSDIAKNGKHYVTQHHDWAKINQKFASYF